MSERKNMKPVAIQKFYDDVWTDGWINHCAENSIPFEAVNCFKTDIVQKLKNYSALFWNFNPWRYEDLLFARHILKAAESLGLKVFPNEATRWHYDDKIAQKYLLESVDAPLAPTYVFFNLKEALDWIDQTGFPVIGKLRRGAASNNVFLLKTRAEGRAFCKRMFGPGISPAPRLFSDMGVRMNKAKKLKSGKDLVLAFSRLALKITEARRHFPPEKGYALFQEFLPANTHDIRIFVIGTNAWGFTRNMRKNDFRASGSGSFDYSRDRIPDSVVKAAITVSQKLGFQAMTYDFLRDGKGDHKMIEISFGTFSKPYFDCAGHWDQDIQWHEGHTWPQAEIFRVVMENEK
jgi:glutathione synthase/RimK-type ligase-like ATP-grasp enzyme